jgi:hypothetical protein
LADTVEVAPIRDSFLKVGVKILISKIRYEVVMNKWQVYLR